MTQKRAGVLGHPIANSLSPALHKAAYEHLGLDWSYTYYDVTTETLPQFLQAMDSTWAGLSLTMPLKLDVIPLLDHVDPFAKLLGSVNTVLVQPAPKTVLLVGANTDVAGLVSAIEPLVGRPASAAVIGGGATARSAVAALAQLGCRNPRIHVRSIGRSGPLIRVGYKMELDLQMAKLDSLAESVKTCDIVIATTPVDAHESLIELLSETAPRATLLDVVYAPDPTPLVAWWRTYAPAHTGLAMLVYQAAEQVRLMTSRDVDPQILADAVNLTLPG